jgi:hypothetical protein
MQSFSRSCDLAARCGISFGTRTRTRPYHAIPRPRTTASVCAWNPSFYFVAADLCRHADVPSGSVVRGGRFRMADFTVGLTRWLIRLVI